MPLLGLARVLLLVAGRALLVLGVAVPVLLLLALVGVFGRGGDSGLFLFVTVGLAALGWAFLPFIHSSRASGVLFGCCWFAFAVFHIATQPPGSLIGAAVSSWLIATLFLAIKLRGNLPGYFPQSWRNAFDVRPPDNGA